MTAAVGPIAFAEKVLALLELGSYSATYKYALFTAIMDLCLEQTSANGMPPSTLTTRQLAEKVTEIYWPHATPYDGGAVLRQGGVRPGNQAEILTAISSFRSRHAGEPGELLHRAGQAHPDALERLLRTVEWKLVEMPIPRLQVMGREEDRFLYEYGWTQDVRQGDVTRYQCGEPSTFDNTLRLQPRVAEHLIALTGVLRPVIRREWALMVAAMNALPESRLEEFLFGTSRIPLDAVRAPLRDFQGACCFYCERRLDDRTEVDHFIPWARYADNSLDNLVLSHARCNQQKRDFFAAAEHLTRWTERSRERDADLGAIATSVGWPRNRARSLAVARVMYARLPAGARLWVRGNDLVPWDGGALASLFGHEARP